MPMRSCRRCARPRLIPSRCPATADGLKERPEAANLVGIYAAMAGLQRRPMCWRSSAAQGFGAFKPALGELLVEGLAPITARYRELRARYRRARCDPRRRGGARPRAGRADSDAGLMPPWACCRARIGAVDLAVCNELIDSFPSSGRFCPEFPADCLCCSTRIQHLPSSLSACYL